MKFNLTQAKFIPQSNVNKSDASLEHLITIPVKVEEKFDLVFNKDKSTWKINKDFVSLQLDNEGWTAAYQDGFVFLIKTNTSQLDVLQPKFLKGKCHNVFKSDYFSLIMGEAFTLDSINGFYLEKQEQQEIDVYLVTNIKSETSICEAENSGESEVLFVTENNILSLDEVQEENVIETEEPIF